MILAAVAPEVWGQERLLPIRLGRVLFYPSVTLSSFWDDNVENVNEEEPLNGPISSQVLGIQPALRFELLLRKSSAKLTYKGDFRDYSAQALKDLGGASHFLHLDCHFEAASRLRVDVAEHYVDAIAALLNAGVGGEFRYGTQPLKSNETHLVLGWDVGPIQSVEVGGIRNNTQFGAGPTASFFSNYSSDSLFLHYVFSNGPQSQLYASLDFQSVNQTRLGQANLPNQYQTRSLGAGYRRASSRDLTNEIRVEYSTANFKEGLGTPFRGVTLEADMSLRPTATNQFQVRLRRAPLVSFFNSSGYFVNEMVVMNYGHALSRSLGIELSVGAQNNVFSDAVQVADSTDPLSPSEGRRRHDHILVAGLSGVWHVSRSMDLNFGYRFDRARSNIDAQCTLSKCFGARYGVLDYDSRTVQVAAVLGWQ